MKNEINLSEEYVGSYLSILALVSGLSGSALAALLVDKICRRRGALLAVGVIILAELSLGTLFVQGDSLSIWTTGASIAFRSAAGAFLFSGLYGIFMAICDRAQASTEFAAIMAFGQIGNALGGAIGGLVLEMGWGVLFFSEVAASLLVFPVLLALPDRVAALDENAHDIQSSSGELLATATQAESPATRVNSPDVSSAASHADA